MGTNRNIAGNVNTTWRHATFLKSNMFFQTGETRSELGTRFARLAY